MLHNLQIGSLSVDMYNMINNLSAIVLFFYVFSHIKAFTALSSHCAAQKKPLLWGSLYLLMIYAVFSILFYLFNPKFGDWFTNGNKNYYGTLTAWFIAFTFVPAALKISPFKVQDLFSAGLPLQLVLAKIACFCWGCCSSFEMEHCFYFNYSTGRYEFPIQLLEAGVALLLFLFMLRYTKQNKKTGTVFPIYLTLYSISRFLTEFLRADLPNILGPFDAYQIMSIIFTAFGMLLLWIVNKYRDTIEARFQVSGSAARPSGKKNVRKPRRLR